MPRVIVKGGVWKNSEDEILKAAVMKYGKNQWARISSLLVRKTPKQCKARWYEWLDPSIRKTEWSKDEDERLLHLAKILPCQWRSIAPMIKRTPAQCLERYEQLLDRAQGRDEEFDKTDDPRKLKPGEVDPNPETKPARPDPVDMDEDEKEMLAEARARLANTQGKKAKRKAREKQLEEAKRLASLQKRREMKAAGLPGFGRRRRYGLDLNKEIPFEKKVPGGFFDTTDEVSRTRDDVFKGMYLQKTDAKKYSEIENEQRKQAERKLKEKKIAPPVVSQLNKLAEIEQMRKRPKLNLPAPQVGEAELEEIVKMGQAGAVAKDVVDDENLPSKSLLPSYAALTPMSAAQRTPRTATALTPGGAIAATPRTPVAGTPMFAQRTPRSTIALTPGSTASPTPRTPAAAEYRAELRKSLSSLPKPKNEFEIVLPEINDDLFGDDNGQGDRVEDAVDVERRRQAELRRLEEEEFKSRSLAVQRDLPRPSTVNTAAFAASIAGQGADALVRAEMLLLLKRDAVLHPPPGAAALPASAAQQAHVEAFQPDEIARAAAIVAAEEAKLRTELDDETFAALWEETYAEWVFVPATQSFTRASAAAKADCIASLSNELQINRSRMMSEAKKASKHEGRLNVLLGGYQSRAFTLTKQINETHKQLENARVELVCFRELASAERQGLQQRVERLRVDVDQQRQRESELQKRYGALVLERDLLSGAPPVST